jgi:chemotaxis regulatin CheY-phosphate phosphatase CheZ
MDTGRHCHSSIQERKKTMNHDSLDKSLSDCVRNSNADIHLAADLDDKAEIMMEFIEHVRGIIPLLEQVKDSIIESSSRIPKASMQLSKVSEATESAAVEILNVLETTTSRISATDKDLETLRRFFRKADGATDRTEAERSVASIESVLQETKNNCVNIAIALQVQDITSQQIAGVAHTIESIRLQLAEALKRFEDPEEANPAETGSEKTIPSQATVSTHFDSDARFSTSSERQDLADEIVKQWHDDRSSSPTQ